MFLTHCVMGWIVLTVLCLCLPVWSAVTVNQPYKVVSTNGTAQIQCFVEPRPAYHQNQHSGNQIPMYPHPDPEEQRVTVLKGLHGTQELCSSILNFTEHRETDVKKEGQVQCFAQVRDGAVEVTLSGLKATDTDIYRCEIEVFYPPPYLRLIGNGTLIHVLDSPDCPEQDVEKQIAHQADEEEVDEGMASISSPVVVLVILIILVLIIIAYFQILQCERGKREIVRQVPGGAHKVDAVACCYENVA